MLLWITAFNESMKIWKVIFFVIAVPAIAVVGYGIMQALVYMLPMQGASSGIYALVSILIIALGLIVPYLMLKAGFAGAHINNPSEKSLDLKDIPKNQKHPLHR